MTQQADNQHLNHVAQACKQGNLTLVKQLISDVPTTPSLHTNDSFLNIALRNGHWRVAEFLYEHNLFDPQHHTAPLIAAAQSRNDDDEGILYALKKCSKTDFMCPRGRTALMAACLQGHIKKTQTLLQHQSKINATDITGMTALLDAINSRNIDVIQTLLKADANIHHQNNEGDNAIILAVRDAKLDLQIVKLLLGHGADATIKNTLGESAITITKHKNKKAYQLIKKNLKHEQQLELPLFEVSSIKSNTRQAQATQTTNQTTTPPLNKQKHALTQQAEQTKELAAKDPLATEWFEAATSGRLGRLHALIQKGIDVNIVDAKGCSGLIHAAGSGNRAVSSFLLQNNADIEKKSNNGSTPLSSAIISNSRTVIELLLSRGANANGSGPGGYAYATLAAAQWNESSLSQLHEYGAEFNIKDFNGNGLIHTSAQAAEYYTNSIKAKNTILFLHHKGLDLNAIDDAGNTPLMILCGAHKKNAYSVDDSRIASLAHELLKLGAQPDITNKHNMSALDCAKKHKLRNTQGVILSFLEQWSIS